MYVCTYIAVRSQYGKDGPTLNIEYTVNSIYLDVKAVGIVYIPFNVSHVRARVFSLWYINCTGMYKVHSTRTRVRCTFKVELAHLICTRTIYTCTMYIVHVY